MINGRPLDPRVYYSIAMPESVAESVVPDHRPSEKRSRDALSVVDQSLVAKAWIVERPESSLAERLLRKGEGRPQINLVGSSFEIGYTNLTLTQPAGRGDTLKKLDVDFRGTTPSNTLTGKLDLDLAMFDARRTAVRVINLLDFSRRTDSTKDPPEVSHADSFGPSVSFSTIPGRRPQRRVQADFDFEPRVTVRGKTWRLGTELRFRYYPAVPNGDDRQLRMALRGRAKLTFQLFSRLEFVPMYEYQLAEIHARTADEFGDGRFEATFKLPFVARVGWGWLVR